MNIETSNHCAFHQPVQATADEGLHYAEMTKLSMTKVESEPRRKVVESETPEEQIIRSCEFPCRLVLKL